MRKAITEPTAVLPRPEPRGPGSDPRGRARASPLFSCPAQFGYHRRGGADAGKARRDREAYLESVLGHYRNYESLFVIAPRGNVLASTRQERWEDWGQGLLDRGGLERGGIVSPIHRSAFLGRPTLLVLHTVQGRQNRTIGYFVERVDLRELESLLGPTEGDPPYSFSLLDEQGRV